MALIGSKVPTENPEGHDSRKRVAQIENEGRPEGPEAPEDPRLDEATHSDEGPWLLTVWESSGEVSIVWNVPEDPEREVTPKGEASDPDRSMREAARRASTMMRRWCTANEADRLGTATYAPDENGWRPRGEDHDQVVSDIARFRRRLREALGHEVALLTVIEPHDDGSLHVHFAFNRFLPKEVIARCWGHGFVDLRRFRAPGLKELSRRQRCRVVAGYLTSYLKKSFHQSHQLHRKRYSTTRGLAPSRQSMRCFRRAGAVALATLTMGPLVWWSSSDAQEWNGPPVMVGLSDRDP